MRKITMKMEGCYEEVEMKKRSSEEALPYSMKPEVFFGIGHWLTRAILESDPTSSTGMMKPAPYSPYRPSFTIHSRDTIINQFETTSSSLTRNKQQQISNNQKDQMLRERCFKTEGILSVFCMMILLIIYSDV